MKDTPIIKQQGYVKAKDIDGSLLNFMIIKSEIDNHDTYRVGGQLKELRKAGASGKNALVLGFMGYDSDPREIYQIPEIQRYMRAVFKKFPELFYFLNIEGYTFAIMANAIFTSLDEVKVADQAMIELAKESGDNERIITVDYYTSHQQEFHK